MVLRLASFHRVPALAVVLALACAAAACGDDAPGADAGPELPDGAIPAPVGEFPTGFLWGTAIAPYQVEGGLHETDWYQWESLCVTEGQCSGDSADDGPDFWNKYAVDLGNAAMMHNNAIRIGIEWARVFPTQASFPDAPDAAAVARYHEILDEARARGLNPMVTLHHFSTPTWLADMTDLATKPGWVDPGMVEAFATWAAFAGAEFGADVDWWVTINEPFVIIAAGYMGGLFPPALSGQVDAALAATEHMIRGHARAYDALHSSDTVDADGDGVSTWVSIATHNRVWQAKDPQDPEHVEAADMLRFLNNRMFLDAVVFGDRDNNFDGDTDDPDDLSGETTLLGRLDYVGLNYYGMSLVVPTGDALFPFIGIGMQNDLDLKGIDIPQTEFAWGIYPQGLREVIDELDVYDLPILITENGLADRNDDQRPRWLIDHLYELAKAIGEGVDIRGYYHWSLLDNFEWASGFCPEFGLFHVDWTSADKPRTAGEGVEVYRRIIDANTVPVELFGTYPRYPPADYFCPPVGI